MSDIYGIAKSGLQAYKEGLLRLVKTSPMLGTKTMLEEKRPLLKSNLAMMFCKCLILLGLALK